MKLGLQVGDKLELTLEEDSQGDLANTVYTITGVVEVEPLGQGAHADDAVHGHRVQVPAALHRLDSLASGSVDAFVYIPGENFTFEHYTSAYFTGEGLAGLDTYRS